MGEGGYHDNNRPACNWLQGSEDARKRPPAMWTRYRRQNKKQIRLYLNADVLEWFRGRDAATRRGSIGRC
jgi:hypothetical protein